LVLLLLHILGLALFFFWVLLLFRVVIEFICSFSRDWRPTGLLVVVLEAIMSVTDPPVKLLRRLIPQLTIGAVRIDLSIMVLLLVFLIGWQAALGARA
jgi:YggT family protein